MRKRPFDCSRCGTELEIRPMAWLAFAALPIFWWVTRKYGYFSTESLATMGLLCLIIAIMQLLWTPVRRAVPI